MHIYEYLFSGVLIIALLIGATVMLTSLSIPTQNAAAKNQLQVTAEKIITQILLDPGYAQITNPYEWGSSGIPQQNLDLRIFGLAKYGDTTRQAYVLDPDKVLRLKNTIEGSSEYHIQPSTAANLLGLGNDYGFTLEFNETLCVSSPIQFSNGTYFITILSQYGLPIIGANVSATLYYIDSGKIARSVPVYGTTGNTGSFIFPFDFNPHSGNAQVLVVAINYYGAQAVKFYPTTASTISATLFGSSIISDPSNPYNIASGANEVVLIKTDQGFETRDFAVENSGSPNNFVLANKPEPSAIGVLAVSDGNLLVAQRDFLTSFRTIPAVRSTGLAYSLERTVLIGGSTYTATLYLWRTSV